MSRKKEWIFRVQDMLECIAHIERLAGKHKDEASFHEDIDSYRACERNIEIIAEASKHLPDEVRQDYPQVPWQDIIGMRNIISHQYESVDESIVWSAIQRNLPELRAVLAEILKKQGGDVSHD